MKSRIYLCRTRQRSPLRMLCELQWDISEVVSLVNTDSCIKHLLSTTDTFSYGLQCPTVMWGYGARVEHHLWPFNFWSLIFTGYGTRKSPRVVMYNNEVYLLRKTIWTTYQMMSSETAYIWHQFCFKIIELDDIRASRKLYSSFTLPCKYNSTANMKATPVIVFVTGRKDGCPLPTSTSRR